LSGNELVQREEQVSKQFTIIRSKQPPYEGLAKLTGRAKFGEDTYFPNLLHGKILRSEYAHAKILSLNISKAEQVDGVRAIITCKDFPSALTGEIADQSILASDRVLYYGQPICVVAAETPDLAERALGEISVEYQELPVVSSSGDALRDTSVEIHPEKRPTSTNHGEASKRNVCTSTKIRKGNPEDAFKEADFTVEETYAVKRVHQSYIEPRAATASLQPDGKILVWTSTQSPFLIRSSLCKILSLPPSQIQVFATSIGGGFGGKIFPEIEAFCAMLSKKSKRPVKIVLSREEEFIAGNPRPEIEFRIKSAVKAGKITAREGKAIVDTGAFGSEGAVYANMAALQLIGPYSIESADVEAISVYTNKPPAGSYRGPGSVETAFAVESHTDSLAKKGRMDPVEFRMLNLSRDGASGPTGQILSGVGVREGLRKVADAIGWKDRKRSNPSDGQIRRGIGFACGLIPSVGVHSSGAIIRMDDDGKIVLETGAQDIGTGALSGLKMIAAEELGVSCEDVTLRNGNTDSVPYDGGAQGSRTTYGAGNAVLSAARDAKNQILEVASMALGASKALLFLEDGKVKSRNSPTGMNFSEVASIANFQIGGPIIGRGSFVKGFPEYDKECIEGYVLCPSLPDPAYVAHAAEVEVNLETGAVRVIRYVAAHDVGTAINPWGIEGQIYGGVVQGIGYALLEKMEYDSSALGSSSLSFNEYKIPTATEIPKIETFIVEGHYGEGPYGAKGVGEANIVPPAGAIANAIFDAVGKRVNELPVTFEALISGEGKPSSV
jgi:CO/xanthine dehydrogenase Mo-binding subunit